MLCKVLRHCTAQTSAVQVTVLCSLHYTTLQGSVMHCTAPLHFTVLHWPTLQCNVLTSIWEASSNSEWRGAGGTLWQTAVVYTVQYSAVMYTTMKYCTVH